MDSNHKSLVKVICYLIVIITLLPLIILSFYNYPLVDDYVYASSLREMGFIKSQIAWYTRWTGRYMATLLICTNPVYWNWAAGATVIPILLISFFSYSLYYFINSFKIFQAIYRLTLFAIILAFYLSTWLTVGQAFYWFAGAYTYTIATSLMLIIWGYIFRLYCRNSVGSSSYFIIGILMFVMLGLNELIVFYNCYIAALFVLHSYLKKRDKLNFFIIILTLSVGFGLLNAAAPGNFTRQGSNPFYPFSAIYTALSASLKMWMARFVFTIPFCLTLFFVVLVSLRDQVKRLSVLQLGIHPFILFCALLGGYSFTFLPGTLANAGNESRTLNFSYFTFLIAIIVSTVYTIHYYNLSAYFKIALLPEKYFMFSLILVAGIILFYPSNKIIIAYQEIVTGKVSCYEKEMTARHAFLKSVEGSQKVLLKPLTCQPQSYFNADVRTVDDWRNAGYQNYYKIDTVRAAY